MDIRREHRNSETKTLSRWSSSLCSTVNRLGTPPSTSKLPWKFIPRLLDAAFKELMLIITGQQDSWFIDLPLSDLGLEQSEEFKKFLADNQSNSEVKLILGDSESKSTMVSSNLRRAISTGVVGACGRPGSGWMLPVMLRAGNV